MKYQKPYSHVELDLNVPICTSAADESDNEQFWRFVVDVKEKPEGKWNMR